MSVSEIAAIAARIANLESQIANAIIAAGANAAAGGRAAGPGVAMPEHTHGFDIHLSSTGKLYRTAGWRCVIDQPWENVGPGDEVPIADGKFWMRYAYSRYSSSGGLVGGTGEWDEGFGDPPEQDEDHRVFLLAEVSSGTVSYIDRSAPQVLDVGQDCEDTPLATG